MRDPDLLIDCRGEEWSCHYRYEACTRMAIAYIYTEYLDDVPLCRKHLKQLKKELEIFLESKGHAKNSKGV